jgi:hypothetical protein
MIAEPIPWVALSMDSISGAEVLTCLLSTFSGLTSANDIEWIVSSKLGGLVEVFY